ncbi:unnamed protein product [Candida verbasci]|uniref:Uncharacterized protein n=1 Tax=Candida verbasci TaxID=1227364 RepID=A0A9W4TUR1_9ASCO|nr:unnamed protein product [Candida verbasci]
MIRQICQFPSYGERIPGPKCKAFVHMLSIEKNPGSNVHFTAKVTDYTKNKQSKTGAPPFENTSTSLFVPPGNILEASIHRDRLNSISNLYGLATNKKINLAKLVDESSGEVDISNLLILVSFNFALRFFDRRILPFTWDENVVNFNLPMEEVEKQSIKKLLLGIFQNRDFVVDISNLIYDYIPDTYQNEIEQTIEDGIFSDSDYAELEEILQHNQTHVKSEGVERQVKLSDSNPPQFQPQSNEIKSSVTQNINTEYLTAAEAIIITEDSISMVIPEPKTKDGEPTTMSFKELRNVENLVGQVYKIFAEIIFTEFSNWDDPPNAQGLKLGLLERNVNEENQLIEVLIPDCDLTNFFNVSNIEQLKEKIDKSESIFAKIKGKRIEMEIIREKASDHCYWKSLMRM